MEANHTYCVIELYLRHISIVSCRQKEYLVVALSVRLLSLAPWTDTYPDGIAQPWIRCSNIEIGNGIEGDMLTRSRCRKRDSPTSLMVKKNVVAKKNPQLNPVSPIPRAGLSLGQLEVRKSEQSSSTLKTTQLLGQALSIEICNGKNPYKLCIAFYLVTMDH